MCSDLKWIDWKCVIFSNCSKTKWRMDVKLCDSNYCRLCAEENKNRIYLFTEDENTNSLVLLVNKYLPVTVENDFKFPKHICPGCHIQLEATKLFMDLIVEGQSKLRTMYHAQQEKLQKEAKQKQQLEDALHTVNPNSTVETYSIQTDETGDKFLIQIYTDGPLFPPEHELSLKADGLDKPRRKRGRPPKQLTESNKTDAEPEKKDEGEPEQSQGEDEIGEDGRKRRKIKAPSRFAGVVQGKELEKILKEEGVWDDENNSGDTGFNSSVDDTVIGRTESETGEDLGKPVFIHRPKIRSRYGFMKKGKKKFKCDICSKEFFHPGRCEFHKKSHNIYYICRGGCEFENKDRSLVEKHQLETGHTGISVIDKQESIGGVLQLPEGAENAENPPREQPTSQHECPECRKTFSNKQNLDVHSRTVHSKEKPFECTKCDKQFAYSNSLKLHMMKHDREDAENPPIDYPCDVCGKVLQHPSSLLYHQETEHSNGRRFVCTTCNKGFKHRQLLQRHQLVHSDERPFACDKCDSTFKTQANLMNHEAVHTGEKKFCCGQCGQKFAHRTSLSLHQRWHEGHKPYVCEYCDKSFSQKGNLSEHTRIHTGEKPFYCDQCGKFFTTSSQFNIHVKRHTGEKPWTCEHCSKSFLHKDTFQSHVRRHLDQRPFVCPQCPRAFTEQWALKRHERTHTGERPYSCDHCDKTFADSSNKKKHMRVHKFADNVKFVNKPTPTDADGAAWFANGATGTLQLTQLVDRQGNPISIRTESGETVPVVTTGGEDESFQGLMPDGTLVPIEIESVEEKDDSESVNLGLLDGTSQEPVILSSDSILQVNGDTLDPNLQLLTDDGGRQEMCLVTYAIDENGEVTQELAVDQLLIQN